MTPAAELLRGLECVGEATHVCCVASTNVPWELDAAVVRRFERRLCVGLPDADARRLGALQPLYPAVGWH